MTNKVFNNGDLDERFEVFEKRFVSKELIGTENSIPKEVFYPTSDFKDVINEVVNQMPTNFHINGKESEFLRKNLLEKSYLKSTLNSVYQEGCLSSSSFVVMKPKFTLEENEELMSLELEVLAFENCYPEYDILTGELKKLTYQEQRYTYNGDMKIPFLYTVEYTKKSIKKYIRSLSGSRIPDMPDNIEDDNPFMEYDILPVVEFKCSIGASGNPYDFKAFASRLIEAQLQIDNLNTNIENLINLHSNPIYVVKNTYRNWDGFQVGAGQLITLQENEDFDVKRSDMQLVALAQRMKSKKDEIYKTGGLVPLSLRDRMYGTDSSKVVKIASSELIGIAKMFMNNFKKPLLTIAKALLMLNGRKLTDEIVSPPEEILPYDLESVFASMAVGMNLGLVDAEWFWDRYMPELSEDDKKRITESYEKRISMAESDTNNEIDTSVNVDNRAKVDKTPVSKKKQKEMTKSEKEEKILK